MWIISNVCKHKRKQPWCAHDTVSVFFITIILSVTECKLSDWGPWSECRETSVEKRTSQHAPFSFSLPATATADRGRAMMKIAVEEKSRIAEERRKCQADNSCPEFNPRPTVMAETKCVNGKILTRVMPQLHCTYKATSRQAENTFPITLFERNQSVVGGNTREGIPWSPMMTSWNGNIFRVTGHLCGEIPGPRWIPRTKASDAELWCFLWSASELSKQSWGWWFETPSCSLWRHPNDRWIASHSQ